MLFEILKTTFILAIALPFVYMIYDVTVDVLQRFRGFYVRNAKPVLVRVRDPFKR